MCGGSCTREYSWVWALSQVTLGSSCTHGFSPEVFAHRQVAGRPLGFLYSWVLLMFGLRTLSGGPPLGEPTCTGTSPTMS
jgi:hypothetical protein